MQGLPLGQPCIFSWRCFLFRDVIAGRQSVSRVPFVFGVNLGQLHLPAQFEDVVSGVLIPISLQPPSLFPETKIFLNWSLALDQSSRRGPGAFVFSVPGR